MGSFYTVGIISLGEMGAGIARLLKFHGLKVVTNVSDRSSATQTRAKEAGVELLASVEELLDRSDSIFSIVPPRDARATAERIISAYKSSEVNKRHADRAQQYIDFNAIAPSTARSIAEQFSSKAPLIQFIDAGIIGGAPKPSSAEKDAPWTRPSIPYSGPHRLNNKDMERILNLKYLDDRIGTASGLKCCFASMTKGYTALAIQAFSTASQLGVLPQLEAEIKVFGGEARLQQAQRSLVGMGPKAGRWIDEMREIGKTFSEEGGWDEQTESIFGNVAGVYEFVANDTVLGKEHFENRKRGTASDDVAAALVEGLEYRRKRRRSV